MRAISAFLKTTAIAPAIAGFLVLAALAGSYYPNSFFDPWDRLAPRHDRRRRPPPPRR